MPKILKPGYWKCDRSGKRKEWVPPQLEDYVSDPVKAKQFGRKYGAKR